VSLSVSLFVSLIAILVSLLVLPNDYSTSTSNNAADGRSVTGIGASGDDLNLTVCVFTHAYTDVHSGCEIFGDSGEGGEALVRVRHRPRSLNSCSGPPPLVVLRFVAACGSVFQGEVQVLEVEGAVDRAVSYSCSNLSSCC
jgi:hypothetical protein